MQGHGESLASAYTSGAPATQGPVTYKGGRGALVITATVFPTTVTLQYVAKGGNISMNAVNITTNGVYVFDLPAGQYQLFLNGGAATNLNADLVSVRYG